LRRVGTFTRFGGDACACGACPVGLLPARPAAVAGVGTTIEPRPAYSALQFPGGHSVDVTASCNVRPRVWSDTADSKRNAHNGVAFTLAGCGCRGGSKRRVQDGAKAGHGKGPTRPAVSAVNRCSTNRIGIGARRRISSRVSYRGRRFAE
jgi:hypothetical protein